GERSEVPLRLHADGVNGAADGRQRDVALDVQVVQLEPRVVVEIPVEAEGVLPHLAAVDAVVVQVHPRVAIRHLPGTRAVAALAVLAADQEGVLVYLRTVVDALAAVVAPVLAGQEVTHLSVRPPERRRATRGEAARRSERTCPIDVGEGTLRPEVERPPG